MPRTGPTYNLPTSSFYPAVAGVAIDPDGSNSTLQDIATALTGSLARSGAGGMQAALPLNGYKITGVGDGTDDTDAANLGQTQAISANGTAFAALTFAANTYMYATGAATFTTGTITADGRSLIAAANYAAMRTALSLVIGTNVQAWNANLDTWAGKTAPSGIVVGTTDSQTLENKTLTSPTINGGTVQSRIPTSSETTGTLTAASRNATVQCSGGITLDDGVFTAGDYIMFDAGGSNRTFTRASGLTMLVNGSDSASATLAANTMGSAYWRSASVCVLSGSFS
jgi:hypothetical protein